MIAFKGNTLSISDFIRNWNEQYPLDRWWRKRYNIPFGSPEHLKTSFIDQVIEFGEDEYFEKLKAEKEAKELEEINGKSLGAGKHKQVIEMTKQEIDDEFENLDLSKF